MRLPAISPLGKSPSMAVGESRGVFVCSASAVTDCAASTVTCCARANGLTNSGISANAKLFTFIVIFSLAPSRFSVPSMVSVSGSVVFVPISRPSFCSALFSSGAASSWLLRMSVSPAGRSCAGARVSSRLTSARASLSSKAREKLLSSPDPVLD